MLCVTVCGSMQGNYPLGACLQPAGLGFHCGSVKLILHVVILGYETHQPATGTMACMFVWIDSNCCWNDQLVLIIVVSHQCIAVGKSLAYS